MRLARNLGGKKTLQDSACLTPDLVHLCLIQDLLCEAKINRSQNALKELVCHLTFNIMPVAIALLQLFFCDGYFCPLTGYDFNPDSDRAVKSRSAHILPFSFHKQVCTICATRTIDPLSCWFILASHASNNRTVHRTYYNSGGHSGQHR